MGANNISSGINFSKYDKIKITVTGENKPEPVDKFSEAGLCSLLVSNITRANYTTPTPVQKYALPIIMAGRDLMACAQTGSGKTAAFLLPIINKFIEASTDGRSTDGGRVAPQAIIISPTRELAIQIYDEARKFAGGSNVHCQVAYGGTSVMSQRSMLNRGCNILVATPGRLLDFVERGYVSFKQVQFLILDEADRMLDMGFMPDIRRCVDNPSMPPKNQRQTLMFSATFPSEVQRSASDFLHSYLFLQVGLVGGACTDVKQTFHQASTETDSRGRGRRPSMNSSREGCPFWSQRLWLPGGSTSRTLCTWSTTTCLTRWRSTSTGRLYIVWSNFT